MITIVISGALDQETDSFQSKEAKDIRAMIELLAGENGAQVENIQADHGIITLDMDDKAGAKVIDDLTAMGFTAVHKDYKTALQERITRRLAEKKIQMAK